MRIPLVLLALALALGGCPLTAGDAPACQQDSECGGEVCARDEQCYPAAEVREVTVTWTVDGAPADETVCQGIPRLYIQFLRSGDGGQLDFTPVPCELGRFFVDKLPRAFGQVEIGVVGGSRSTTASIGGGGMANLDLRF